MPVGQVTKAIYQHCCVFSSSMRSVYYYEACPIFSLVVTLYCLPYLTIDFSRCNNRCSFAEVSLTEPAISQTIPSATTETVDALVEQIMAERHIPGFSLAVVRDGKLVKTQSYGYLNRDLNVHTRPSSVFPIASVSKPFTATAIMLLVQSGQIELDAPISTYLTDTPAHWENITVRHLLTHTAGLSESVYANRLRTIQTLSGFQTQASKVPLDFQPGEAWAYSNTGYNLAARIIETVSGQSFEAFMESRIFEPIGMGSTDVVRESYDFSNRATGYFWDGGSYSRTLLIGASTLS